MSKKHFVAAAKYIASLNAAGRHSEAEACYRLIVDIQDNPSFSVQRFRMACEFPKEEDK